MEKLFFCNFSIFFVGQKKINVYLCIRNKNKERTKKKQKALTAMKYMALKD